MFAALGIGADEYGCFLGELPGAELVGRCTMAIALADDSGTVDVHYRYGEGTAQVTECGRRPGYLADVFTRLLDLGTVADSVGQPVVYG